MIRRLPSRPGRPRVTRIDWMISLILRSTVRSGSWTRAGSRSRWRTSCWVMVERTAPVTLERVEGRRADGHRVEAGVRPEGLVLDRGQGVEQRRRDLVEGDDLAALCAEAGQLDLAVAVLDDRLLVEGDVLERGRLGQVPCIERVRGDGADEGDTGDSQKGGEEEEGEGDRGCARHSSAAPAAAISAARTAALEARLHARGYVTILGRLALPASWTHGQARSARTPSALDAWAVTFVPSVRSAC